MKQSKKITFFCTAMLASMTLFAANDLMSNQATQAVKAATSLTVSSSINSYILNSKFAVSNVTKELHTFSMFNYSTSDKKPNGIVFHYTDNPNNFSARNEADYEINGGWQDAFVHTFIDATTILNIHDTDFGSWGGGPMANARFVQFELVTARNREEFAKSINNAAWYTASMAVKYNWTLTPATVNGGGTLWTHHDVTRYLGGTNHVDPDAYLAKWGYDTTQFLDLAKYYYGELANKGSFDRVAMSSTGLQINGWHAAGDAKGKNYSYLIVMDANTNTEISRYKINRNVRNDVAQAYPNLYGAANSGFSYTVPLSNKITNRKIRIISRYSSNPSGSTDYVDYESDTYDFSQNLASFDKINLSGNDLTVNGWHAADGSITRPYHYIIFYNATDKREISRVKVDNTQRLDVKNAYPNIYNSQNSGFTASMKFDRSLSGKDIQIISRYSDRPSGEGDTIENWSHTVMFNINRNEGWIDSVRQNGTDLRIGGWNIADESVGKQYSYLFLMNLKGQEIARFPLNRVPRVDVQNMYPQVYNSLNSGFLLNTPITAKLRGQTFTIKLRYSSNQSGSTNYVDTDFSTRYQIPAIKNGTENKGSLDTVRIDGQNAVLKGWHSADTSDTKPYRYLFLLDKSTKSEIARYSITSVNREDVAKAYPNINNAGWSGFSVTVPIENKLLNRNLIVMTRYTDDVNGNGNSTDYWYNGDFKF